MKAQRKQEKRSQRKQATTAAKAITEPRRTAGDQSPPAGAPPGEYRELKMHFYDMISKHDENPIERQLAEFTAETAGIKLQINDIPELYFIEESSTAA